MGEYATKTTDEEGKTKWQATDGKTYSTRSGAWKWSKRLEQEQGDSTTREPDEAPQGAAAVTTTIMAGAEAVTTTLQHPLNLLLHPL